MHGKQRYHDRTTSVASAGEPVSISIVYRIAARLGREPTDIPPLAESVDPDGIDAIFDGSGNEDTVLTFSHAGCDVEVRNGEITVTGR
jgi:hypothetical protein